VTRWVFYAIVIAFAIWMFFALEGAGQSGGEPLTDTSTDPAPTVPPPTAPDAGAQVAALERQLRAERVARRRERRAFRRQLAGVRSTMLHRASVGEAINLATVVYGNGTTLWRRARCESTLNPYASSTSGATGLYQFLPSTWRSTPFGRFSIWSPYAQSLAAAWMIRAGRGSEWQCG
jgi:hypothetical protein